MKKAMVYTKKLEGAGLTREQAEAHLEILEEIFDMDVATKQDITNIRTDMQNMKSELLAEFRYLENKLVIKLGALMCVALGGIATFFKFLN